MGKIQITINTVVQRNNEILTSDLDGEKVMLSIQHGEYFGLGKTGTFIWDNIETPIKITELIDLITTKYSVEKEKCFNDILPFIIDLVEKDLVIATN